MKPYSALRKVILSFAEVSRDISLSWIIWTQKKQDCSSQVSMDSELNGGEEKELGREKGI